MVLNLITTSNIYITEIAILNLLTWLENEINFPFSVSEAKVKVKLKQEHNT